ncbi:MAG: hypothetical protein Pg6C_20810 [Treponemataceae bacterium]|nr:MAG: hypothetical protein Pg6C_20810 [Treponemataceae bacterium]
MKNPVAKLLGIFVGEEIHYTKGYIPQSEDANRKLGGVNFPDQATGYVPLFPINFAKIFTTKAKKAFKCMEFRVILYTSCAFVRRRKKNAPSRCRRKGARRIFE